MIHFFKKSGFRLFTHALTVNHPNSGRRATRWLCQFVRDGVEFESTTSSPSPSWEGLIRCSANYVPLSPISFLERAAKVFGKRVAVVHGSLRFTWEETRFRCVKLASALAQLGISRGDVVATLAPNIPAMQELHFAVPMSGAVICTLNTRHNSTMLSNLLRHSEAKVLFVDYHLLPIAQEAINLLVMANADGIGKTPILVVIPESDEQISSSGVGGGDHEYETLLGTGEPEFSIRWPRSEWDPISINYTSGTTSQPKGVVFCHRGAYLNAIATFSLHDMNSTMMSPVYLWTVPMFHCNGWCLIWGLAALGGTNIFLRKVCPKEIFQRICQHKVTHMGGAPTVLNMILNSSQNELPHKVALMTGGSPPPPEIIYNIEKLGFIVSHLYGLTEVYGPGTHCLWKPEWDSLPPSEQAKFKARQGVQHLCMEEVDVIDHITMKSVPADGKTLGEIMFRGNTVMSGYLKDKRATEEAFRDGWFRSGDLAVKHPDNYIELKDRMKDIIISGGENISSVEVETVLYRHPAVLEAAVVGRPDKHWGQTPCAFVKLKQGFDQKIGAEELIGFCRNQMSHYMVPRTIIFEEIPKTSTGKIQKFILAEKAKALGSLF